MHASQENLKLLRRYCLSLPEAFETNSWGHPNFRAGRGVFATFERHKGIPSVAVRIDSAERVALMQDSRFFPTPYAGNRSWISVRADRRLPWALLQDLVLKSYRIVALKRMLVQIDRPSPRGMMTTAEIIRNLKARGSRKNVKGMERFGIAGAGRLGVSMPDIRRIAKEAGRNHDTALRLWKSGIPEARIVASIVADPGKLTDKEMEEWVSGFDSWDVCDQVCMNLFQEVPFARRKIREWARREEEFVRRAAFALIACLAWHDDEAPDAVFTGFLPLIKRYAGDERNFVKKAVNWALRNIGKRNARLKRAAIRTAKELSGTESRSARWIAADALREFHKNTTSR